LKVEKNDVQNFNACIKEKETIISNQNKLINNLIQQIQQYVQKSKEAYLALVPVVKEQKPLPFDLIIENSNWSKKSKDMALSLFNKYVDWCFAKNAEVMKNQISNFNN
jgi:hypothetical protein